MNCDRSNDDANPSATEHSVVVSTMLSVRGKEYSGGEESTFPKWAMEMIDTSWPGARLKAVPISTLNFRAITWVPPLKMKVKSIQRVLLPGHKTVIFEHIQDHKALNPLVI